VFPPSIGGNSWLLHISRVLPHTALSVSHLVTLRIFYIFINWFIKRHKVVGGAVFFPAMAATISGTHCIYPRRDGQAEWAWIYTGMVDPPPFPVLIGLDVAELRWCDERRYRQTKMMMIIIKPQLYRAPAIKHLESLIIICNRFYCAHYTRNARTSTVQQWILPKKTGPQSSYPIQSNPIHVQLCFEAYRWM